MARDIRQPVEIKIHELFEVMYRQGEAKVGSFKRKAKGREYSSPRILLRDYFDKYVGRHCKVLEGKASIGDSPFFQNLDILILVMKK